MKRLCVITEKIRVGGGRRERKREILGIYVVVVPSVHFFLLPDILGQLWTGCLLVPELLEVGWGKTKFYPTLELALKANR